MIFFGLILSSTKGLSKLPSLLTPQILDIEVTFTVNPFDKFSLCIENVSNGLVTPFISSDKEHIRLSMHSGSKKRKYFMKINRDDYNTNKCRILFQINDTKESVEVDLRKPIDFEVTFNGLADGMRGLKIINLQSDLTQIRSNRGFEKYNFNPKDSDWLDYMQIGNEYEREMVY